MDIDHRIQIGVKIARLRKEKGLTQRDLAQLTGFTQANIVKIERGSYSVGLDILNRIAESLGAKVELVKINNNTNKMERYRIVYKNTLISCTAKERVENFIKPYYWSEDVPNWQNFDGDIKVIDLHERSVHDMVIVCFENDDATKSVILDHFYKDNDVYSIEVETESEWKRIR